MLHDTETNGVSRLFCGGFDTIAHL